MVQRESLVQVLYRSEINVPHAAGLFGVAIAQEAHRDFPFDAFRTEVSRDGGFIRIERKLADEDRVPVPPAPLLSVLLGLAVGPLVTL